MLTDFPYMFYAHRIYPNAVLHIGAHEGQERDFYAKYCLGKTVWVEAVPKIHGRLVANIAKYPNQLSFCACLSDVDDEVVTFRVASNKGQSSSMLEFSEHSKEHPDVRWVGSIQMKTIRGVKLMDDNGINIPFGTFLNLDVQGAEKKVLVGLGHLIERVSAIYCEFNEREMYKKCVLEPELDQFLSSFGFVVADRYPTKHGWGDKLYKRKTS